MQTLRSFFKARAARRDQIAREARAAALIEHAAHAARNGESAAYVALADAAAIEAVAQC